MSATAKLVNAVLGDRFSSIDKHELNMAEIIDQEVALLDYCIYLFLNTVLVHSIYVQYIN